MLGERLLLLGGRAADLLGRRRVFPISLGVFVVASAVGGLANEGTLLAVTRFVKGVSAAFTAPAGGHARRLDRGG
jgi:MFS family permease